MRTTRAQPRTRIACTSCGENFRAPGLPEPMAGGEVLPADQAHEVQGSAATPPAPVTPAAAKTRTAKAKVTVPPPAVDDDDATPPLEPGERHRLAAPESKFKRAGAKGGRRRSGAARLAEVRRG